MSIDFYVRIFVRVYTSAETVRNAATKQMYVYQSSGCDSFFTQSVGRKVRMDEDLLCTTLHYTALQRSHAVVHCSA